LRQSVLLHLVERTILAMLMTRVLFVQRELFWKFGFLFPRTYGQAVEIDLANGNSKWKDSEAAHILQLAEYKTFVDKGKGGKVPFGYKKIRCHMVYDVRHDGRHNI
jgi:hypothetical protein